MLWPFAVNWNTPPLLRLEWLTAVQLSRNDSEFTAELRDGARRTLRFETLVGATDAERMLYENILIANQGEVFQLPWWPDQLWITAALAIGDDVIAVTDTTGRAIAAGDEVALIHELQSAIAIVDSVTDSEITLVDPLVAAWPVGTKVVRVFDARIQPQQPLRYLNDRVMAAEVEFSALEEWIAAFTETADYLGLSVLRLLNEASEDLTVEYSRNMVVFDNQIGRRDWRDISGFARRTRPHRFVCDGITEVTDLFNWLAARRGRANHFWLPTQQHDFQVLANITSSAVQITVANAKHTIAYGQPGRNHLFIKLRNGTVFYRRITAIVEINSTTERLTISSALGAAVNFADIEIACYLQLMRLSSDAVEIRYDTDSSVTCVVGLTSVRDDA